MTPTKEMIEYFYNRTKIHIDLVKKYSDKIYTYDPVKYLPLKSRIIYHDKSKYESTELVPYIFITWFHYCKDKNIEFKIPKEINIDKAIFHHIKSNRHHPEFHDMNFNQDVKNKIIDATSMDSTDIAEMVADWMALSNERNNLPIDWAKLNINTRWNFTEDQITQIYELINNCWD